MEELGFVRDGGRPWGVRQADGEGCRYPGGCTVDDCLVTGNSQPLIDKFKVEINKKYKMTDLGPCKWLLGIKVDRDLEARTTSLSQSAYIDSILARFNFTDLKPSSIPIDPSAPLLKSQSPQTLAGKARMANVPYRAAVGSLMYASMGTRAGHHLRGLDGRASTSRTPVGSTGRRLSESFAT